MKWLSFKWELPITLCLLILFILNIVTAVKIVYDFKVYVLGVIFIAALITAYKGIKITRHLLKCIKKGSI